MNIPHGIPNITFSIEKLSILGSAADSCKEGKENPF
jgi:hypothetical protein